MKKVAGNPIILASDLMQILLEEVENACCWCPAVGEVCLILVRKHPILAYFGTIFWTVQNTSSLPKKSKVGSYRLVLTCFVLLWDSFN